MVNKVGKLFNMKYKLRVGCRVDYNKISFLFIFLYNVRFREINKN